MKNINMKSIISLCNFQLYTNRKLILGWSIASFGIIFVYMIFFPYIQEMGQMKLDAIPKEMLEIFGMGEFAEMNNYVSYFAMIFNLLLVAISIFSITFATNLISKEEKTKSIEFLSALEVSRVEIYISKIFVCCIALVIVIIVAAVSTLTIGAFIGGDTFSVVDIISIIKFSSFTPFFFMALGFFISGLSSKIGSPSVGSIFVLFLYLIGYLGGIVGEKLAFFKYLSPFQLFQPKYAIEMSSNTMFELSIYAIIMFVLLIAGALFYKKRDYII